jgi:autotransporter family porin
VAPGQSLPIDQECAARVPNSSETNPANAPYNARTGSRSLPSNFFDPGSNDPRANSEIGARVTGAYTGTTPQILAWVACKWGIDERIVRAQAYVESSHNQMMKGDWTSDPRYCPAGHGLGVDGRPGLCPQSWGLLQVKYRYFTGAFPDAMNSSASNVDTAYAIWRACYEGYEQWLRWSAEPGYHAGDLWGCIGRWYSGGWYTADARLYISHVQAAMSRG